VVAARRRASTYGIGRCEHERLVPAAVIVTPALIAIVCPAITHAVC
jgi:hypothetical protein